MSGGTPARQAALEIMRAIRGGTLADRAFDHAARAMDPRDRAWTHELVYGVLRLRGRIDHRLALLSSRPLERIDPEILDILRLGAYQLLEMGSVPAYAAVSESVDLAKRAAGQGVGGFVNGVLQGLRRTAADQTFPLADRDPVAHMSTWGSHPRWLAERWVAQYGTAGAHALVEADNTRPELYLRVLGDVASARSLLDAAGVATETLPWAPQALRVTSGTAAAALEAAPVIVQDPAAGLVATHGDDASAEVVLDLAAAPGGKTLALAASGPAGRLVVAADLSRSRLARLRQNLARVQRDPPHGAGAVPVSAVVADGRTPPFAPAGLVLLDAPCSGTGTLRRHPDGRWRVTAADLGRLVELQTELMDAAAECVAPGGLLVYATCSLEPEENEEQVSRFLDAHTEFSLEPVTGADASLVDANGMLRVLPHVHGVDGAFMARLRRRN